MEKNKTLSWPWAPMVMVVVGAVMTAVLVGLRVGLLPLLRDAETGRFAPNYPAVVVLLLGLGLLAALAYTAPRVRIDVPAKSAMSTASLAIIAGISLGAVCVYDFVRWISDGVVPPPEQVQMNFLTMAVLYGMLIFGILGGVVFVWLGLQIVAENGTRRGMRAFSVLAPVLWAWFRLAWYQMSYTVSVGWTEKLYDFFMVILELLFLFKFARMVSGIGKVGLGEMLFYAMSTAMVALSGTMMRLSSYVSEDAEAYSVGALAGFADFSIGLFALVLGWALLQGYRLAGGSDDNSDDHSDEAENNQP